MLGKLIRSKTAAVVTTAIVTATVVGGIAYAASSPIDNAGVIHGCYNPSNGAISLKTGAACPLKGKTTPISWNSQGVQGIQGLKGDTGDSGVVTNAVFLRNPARLDFVGDGTWQPLPSGSTSIDVSGPATIVMRFSASVACGAVEISYIGVRLDGQRLVTAPMTVSGQIGRAHV